MMALATKPVLENKASWAVAALAFGGVILCISFQPSFGAEGDGRTTPIVPKLADHPLKRIWSGFHYASEVAQQSQSNRDQNPAKAWYETGAQNWARIEGKAGKSCAACHGDAAKSMKGAATRFPAYFKPWKKLMNIEQRINECRTKFLRASPWKIESRDMLAMSIFVRAQSSGMPVRVRTYGPALSFLEAGKDYYYRRRGQLDMSCAHCHERFPGRNFRDLRLSQGQSNGFPSYRLRWKEPWSLHRRFAACNRLTRAQSLAPGADDYVNLELYLAARGRGLRVEAPSVRD